MIPLSTSDRLSCAKRTQRRARKNNSISCFFFNDTATTEIYTLSLHDALPISAHLELEPSTLVEGQYGHLMYTLSDAKTDRKSTRLNSSHLVISYAVFCLKKKHS